MSDIQAVIWDLGGVIVRTFDRAARQAWEAKLGLQEFELEQAVFGNEASMKAGIGQGSSDDVWSQVGNKFGLDEQQLAALREDFWRGDSIDEQLIGYIRGLRADYKTGMITNAWPETRQLIDHEWQLDAVFDEIVVSAEVGLAKPDPAIYRLALERLQVAPQAAIFIDDFTENVEAAQALEIQAIHFEDRQQTIQQIDRMLGASA